MVKKLVGILDCGFEGITVLEKLSQNVNGVSFIYLNDYLNYPYEGKPVIDITSYIQKNIDKLLSMNVDAIIVVSDVIVEYASDLLSTIKVPLITSVKAITNYVYEKYEQKNMALFAREDILESNMYQKNFKYNRLYNIPSDEIENLINQNEVKTSKSFAAVNEASKLIPKKEVDVIIPSSPFLIKLKTEFNEYLKFSELIDVGNIISSKLIELLNYDNDKKSNIIVMCKLKKQEFKQKTKWLNLKYKYIKER